MPEPKNVEVECIVTTIDEETYRAGKTYSLAEEFIAKYPDSFKPLGWRDVLTAEQKSVAQKQESALEAAQNRYEKARDYAARREAQAEIELAKQRQAWAELLRQEAEGVEQAAEQATRILPDLPSPIVPPPKTEPIAAPAQPARAPGPGHTMPRAERLKHAR